jgi:hypothetical protein
MSSPTDPRNGTGPDGIPSDGGRPAWGQQGDQPWPQQPQGQPWQQGGPQQGQPWQQGAPQQPQPWQPQQGQPQDQPWQQHQPWQQGAPQQPWTGAPGQGHPDQPTQHWPAGGAQPTQQWQQPQQQPAWDQQPWQGAGQPPHGPAQPGHPAGGTPPKKNKAALITAVAVVVALVLGVGVYFLASRGSSDGGKDTPVAAARQLFDDVDNGDIIGLTDTFDPVEAQFVNDLAGDVIEQFKRLGLLTDDATVNNSTGANISIKGITFDDAAEEKPLPDLTVVKLTGGTITINPTQDSNVETDLYRRLRDAVEKKAADEDLPMTSTTEPTTIDIAEVIRDKNNGEPIRISTVQRDGEWYPSLFYTLADYWVQSEGIGPVTAADAIPGAGKGSPEEAVDAMIQAAIAQDATAVIELLPPDEMSAVHTYGKKIVDAIDHSSGAPEDVTVDAEWNVSDVTGGKLLSIRSMQFTSGRESGSIEIDQDAGTVTVSDGSDSQTFDAASIEELIGTGELASIHPNMTDFVERMLKAALGLGVVTTEVDGQWYVSPLRSYSAVFTVLLSGMEQADIEMFIDLLNE